jgi:hypothetical protein
VIRQKNVKRLPLLSGHSLQLVVGRACSSPLLLSRPLLLSPSDPGTQMVGTYRDEEIVSRGRHYDGKGLTTGKEELWRGLPIDVDAKCSP